ncbi:MAG TPA: hypothetical protein VF514_09785 [Bacteroidota bacterium]
MQQGFDPTIPTVEKVLVEPTAEAAGKDQVEEIKARIAGKIREEAKEHAAMTLSDTVFALVPDSRQGSITAILEEMAAEDAYGDIKAVPTPSGRFYFFSKTFIPVDEAFAKSLVEEVKDRMAEKVRGDSRDRVALTPADALFALTPEKEQDQIADLLNEMQTEARFADIKKVTASNGEGYFHSEIYLSGNYAKILLRAAANDPCAAIAETVRDDSRIYPRPTNSQLFKEKAFGIDPDELEVHIAETLGKPEFIDIKKMVHPSTGVVYLYSSQYLGGDQAWNIMDWEEVGRANNP